MSTRSPTLLRRLARLLLWSLVALPVGVALYVLLAPTGRYLRRAAWEEAKILWARRPIVQLVSDTAVDPALRHKLQLVLAARSFAVDSIGLDAEESFTAYSRLERDTLVLVLSAANRDELRLRTWWFPIVGRVPYKGYFRFEDAFRAAREMREDGYDTYLRPASAFSTLGWFNDPLLSTTLRLDSAALANTVIHELTHNSFYAPGQAVFNESFANFVGARGAEWFFITRGDTANVRRNAVDWRRDLLFGGLWTDIYHALDSAFAAHPDDREARLAARDAIYHLARRRLLEDIGPQLSGVSREALERVQLDNAALMARRIYLTDLELFDAVYAREGGNLRRSIGRVMELAKREPGDPYGALRRWLATSARIGP
ncbi:MAG TPA: aminopeptidase [Gemmatimonadaceae bacterium]|nr:aminopeptidase [Gemmatimonadaceae bacterium]